MIKGPADKALEIIRGLKDKYAGLCRVTAFFESTNFLTTHDQILSENIHLVLDFSDGREMQIESASCGYGGQGAKTTLVILETFGVKDERISDLILTHDAVSFRVSPEGNVQYETLDLSAVFLPAIRCCHEGPTNKNMIVLDRNVDISLTNKKVLMYNPQRNNWKGMLNLSSFIKNMEFEYYIGDNSPLENRYYIGEGFNSGLRYGPDRPDIDGAEHVNLVLRGSNFRIACLIDRQCEWEIIESAFLALTGHLLPTCISTETQEFTKQWIKRLYSGYREYHEKINISQFRRSKGEKNEHSKQAKEA